VWNTGEVTRNDRRSGKLRKAMDKFAEESYVSNFARMKALEVQLEWKKMGGHRHRTSWADLKSAQSLTLGKDWNRVQGSRIVLAEKWRTTQPEVRVERKRWQATSRPIWAEVIVGVLFWGTIIGPTNDCEGSQGKPGKVNAGFILDILMATINTPKPAWCTWEESFDRRVYWKL